MACARTTFLSFSLSCLASRILRPRPSLPSRRIPTKRSKRFFTVCSSAEEVSSMSLIRPFSISQSLYTCALTAEVGMCRITRSRFVLQTSDLASTCRQLTSAV
ncbi:hypothetical protein BDR07DRAFT_1432768 [Suillus spraguei]|nr:hypothetical protein BDR07DRAFT_1432768 [Suillus spraguei]